MIECKYATIHGNIYPICHHDYCLSVIVNDMCMLEVSYPVSQGLSVYPNNYDEANFYGRSLRQKKKN